MTLYVIFDSMFIWKIYNEKDITLGVFVTLFSTNQIEVFERGVYV